MTNPSRPMHTGDGDERAALRAERERLLCELTSLPTAAGREDEVIGWIERWVRDRAALRLERDGAGNLMISPRDQPGGAGEKGPIIFEAHLDHPAFVIEAVESPTVVHAAFRGGVLAPYFVRARVVLRTGGERIGGTVISCEPAHEPHQPFRTARIELDREAGFRIGDILPWDLPDARIVDRMLEAPACDDLAAVCAALCALESIVETRSTDQQQPNVRVLLTRAEEVGFIGAIAACKLGTIPEGSRLIALENSRSFDDSPIGGGPIVRVGDRMSVFSPSLTAGVAKIAQQLTPSDSGASTLSFGADQNDRRRAVPRFRWQRKLMPGGACEATAFMAYGHEATCLCLPLGNYHNMANLDKVQPAVLDGAFSGEARIAPEVIALDDFHNLVELLIACAAPDGGLEQVEPIAARLDKLYDGRRFVLDR